MESLEESLDAMVVEDTRIKSPESKVCALLEKLPREIRDTIWRYLLVKPVAIKPIIRVKEKTWKTGTPGEEHEHSRHEQRYSYDWAQISEGENNSVRAIRQNISWTTNPIQEQLRLIENGVDHFKIDDHHEPGSQISCLVHHRNGFGPQIINSSEVLLQPFGTVINIMRTCKQIEEECAAVLYGNNTYQFNTESCHPESDLDPGSGWKITGFPHFRKIPSKAEVSKAIDELLNSDSYLLFVHTDPFIRFLAYIGRRNALLLRDIKLDGMFKSKIMSINSFLGFGSILPIYTLILREICPSLSKLTLHQCNKLDCWTDDLEKPDGMSDEDMMDSIIAKVVLGLPHLQEVQLGAYSKVPMAPEGLDEWGKSVQWMRFVDERHRYQQSKAETSDNTSINNIGPRHIVVRSGSSPRTRRSATMFDFSYAMTTFSWTLTICPCKTIPGHDGVPVLREPKDQDQYGYLPDQSNLVWRCLDAHGGRRTYGGGIFDIAEKFDNEISPSTVP
ncbi:hypothetical protein NHQ30_004014 [Ciborinia camelliae]|nr:hypothetical protein NHQ30_004014 [Ciborinia camelliae]